MLVQEQIRSGRQIQSRIQKPLKLEPQKTDMSGIILE